MATTKTTETSTSTAAVTITTETEAHSPMLEDLQDRWLHDGCTTSQLRRYVKLHSKNPDLGITAVEFTEITGEAY